MNISDALLLPGALPLLLLAPAAALVLWGLDRLRRRRLRLAVGPRFAQEADLQRGRRRARRLLFAAALFFATAAVLQPAWGESARAVERRGVDMVICLDVSRSMLAQDTAPDRLERAREEIRRLAERASGDRMGLVVFAGEARLFVPLTRDLTSLAEMVDLADPLSVGRGGTDLAGALETAAAALVAKSTAPAVILLLTDGDDRDGRGLAAARACAEQGITVHAIGLGSKRGAKIPIATETGEEFLKDRAGADVVTALDGASLRRIADAAGGVYREANADDVSLVPLYEERVLPMARARFSDDEKKERENRFQWPLLIAFLLWMMDLCLSERRR